MQIHLPKQSKLCSISTLCQRVGGSRKNDFKFGKEKKLSSALRCECISSKRRKAHVEEEEFDLLKAFTVEEEDVKEDKQIGALRKTDNFLRDVSFNILAVGKDTLSSGLVWFFWLVATHPSVENKILEEKKAKLILHKEEEDGERRLLFSAKQVSR